MSSSKLKKYSNTLSTIRNINNYTLDDLARKINFSKSAIAKYETDRNTPSIEYLCKISSFFNLSLDYLILSKKACYISDIKFIRFAEKIDTIGIDERFQIEKNIQTLLGKSSKTVKLLIDIKNSMLTNSFIENIKYLLEQNELPQKEIAKKVGIAFSTLSSYKQGKFPKYDVLEKISKFFSISIHYLVTGIPLIFNFSDSKFRDLVLTADNQLSFREKTLLKELMQKILENHNITLEEEKK